MNIPHYKSKSERKYKFVYQTKNLINGKTYVGYHTTDRLDDGYIGCGIRSQAHAKGYRKQNLKSAFISAVNKYGYKNFRREILSFYDTVEECVEEEAFIVNEEWVKNSQNYNTTLGGKIAPDTRITDSETDAKIFNDFMSGMTKKEICRKYDIQESIIYRITKNRDTSNRIIKPTVRQRNSKKLIEQHKKQVVQWFLEGKAKDAINKLVPFNLFSSGILDNVKKYVAIKDDQVYYFNDTKDLQKIPGMEGKCMSHIKPTLDRKQSHSLGYKIVTHLDYLNGVTSYLETLPKETEHAGTVFVKDGKEYVVDRNLNQFAIENNLHQAALDRVIKGKQKQHLGFYLKGAENFEPLTNKYAGIIFIKDGREYTVEHNLTQFAKKHGLFMSALQRVINGQQKTHKGYELK